MTTSVAVIVPTRNRADLAIAAVRSLLAVDSPHLRHVIVSNNSSESAHLRQLEELCTRTGDPRLGYMQPPRSLTMADHWDWAIEETLRRTDATHVALHYDRRVSKPELALLLDETARHPDVPITYLIDLVFPANGRFGVHQMPWSGNLYEIRTARVLEIASRGLLTDLWEAFPVLVNCVTPRAVIEQVRARFGSVCASTSPESCFGFRFSAIAERYLHFDRPLGIHYAYARSNGMGYMRNDGSGTFADFVKLLGDRPWLDAAPLPGVSIGQNSFYHEYSLARRQSGDAKFPPIDMDGYLNDLARGLAWVADRAKREELRELLVQHGGTDRTPAAPPPRLNMRDRVRQQLAIFRTTFRREDKALRYAQQHPIAAVAENDFLALLEPVRVS